jgi:AraC-like DNA-binding protein
MAAPHPPCSDQQRIDFFGQRRPNSAVSTRSILGLLYTLRGLRELGEDPAPVLARHGLDLDKLDPSTQIDRALELRIHVEIAEVLRDPLAGLKTGPFFGFAGYGPLSMLLMTSATAEEAIRLGVHYQRLTYLYSTLRFDRGEPLSTVVLTPLPLPPRAFRYRIDGEVSGTYKLIRDIQVSIGVDVRPERIDLPYPRPPEARQYEAHFGCPVRFGQPEARLWMRSQLLGLRFPTHDAAAHALYRRLCDQQLLQQQESAGNLTERVSLHLGLFSKAFPSAAGMARILGQSERSFRRRLADEGASYRDLVQQARYERARALLRETRLTVEVIATQLGYAEPAAFIHAFQRWAGVSPQAFRQSGPAG